MAETMFLACFSFLLHVINIISAAECFHLRKSNASDEQALMAFKSAIQYDQNNSFITWTPNISFCKWNGVTCSLRRQRVVSLNLSSAGLEGTISPFLGNLSFLTILDLSNNALHGQIPDQLGSLSRLRALFLYYNQLVGSIPASLSGCYSLRSLSLVQNHLTGTIPSALGFLPKLVSLKLMRNNLTGNIPNSLGNITSLQTLGLRENKLYGRLPWELGSLPQLSYVASDHNFLTGEIPSSLTNCTALQSFSADENSLSGELPEGLCSQNTLLRELFLGDNRLDGRIPVTLFNCSQLQKLDLWNNQLTGILPTELGNLHRLTVLSLFGNQFVTGSNTTLPVVDALTNCSLLQIVDLSYNFLTGVIPSSVGQLSTKLEYLLLHYNKIEGQIPPQIGNLTNLTQLVLSGNLLTGAIPSTVSMLQRLEALYLRRNNLQGNIPIEISQLKNLGILFLSENKLSGNIPDSLGNLQQIRDLFLQYNLLTGNIPVSLGQCRNLEVLDLSYNRLRGQVPPQVAGLSNIAFYFNLSNNLLQGSVPPEISNMDKVQAIDISANQFSSHIPNGIGSCVALAYLNLSFNELNGMIPDSLDKLQNLQDLDFSSNNLSGRIPVFLGKHKVLQHLNFSTNNLSGEVPKDGVFKHLNVTSFIGNLGLCGPWVMLAPCSSSNHKSLRYMKRVGIPIVIGVFFTCVLMGLLWRLHCHRRPRIPSIELGPLRISFQELLSASDGFNEANLLGVGSFGKVFKGTLQNGTMVAIKVLNLLNEDARKSFDRECNVLRRVRHRNLLKVITSYSDPDFKALIFPLVANGSLEIFLHPTHDQRSQGQVSSLDLTQRLNILTDIAQGMDYLHHHCFMQVIHCDLKPGNVLIGEDMTAYLTDFGISKLCLGNSMDSHTSTHALKGSIGYIAPEYGVGGSVTTKGDVYSYGILLLEILTGKKPTNNIFVEGMNLQNWVSRCFPNAIGEVVDSLLLSAAETNDEDKVFNCLRQLITVGLLCTKESPQERPSMIDIVKILHSIKDTFLGAPSIPTFQSDLSHLLVSMSHGSQTSLYYLSIVCIHQ